MPEASDRPQRVRLRAALAELCLPIAVTSLFVSPSCLEREPVERPQVEFGTPRAAARLPVVPPPEPPLLRMPLPAGEVVLCAQANHEPPGSTHALPQNLFALDFSARHRETVQIVAAAAGRVGYVFRNSGDDLEAGGGYGNHVKLQHGDEIHTLYAHLSRSKAGYCRTHDTPRSACSHPGTAPVMDETVRRPWYEERTEGPAQG